MTSASARVADRTSLNGLIQRIGINTTILAIALVILIVIFSSLQGEFLTEYNFLNIGRASAILGLLAAGQTIVIISGGIDISVGAVMGMSSVCVALTLNSTDFAVLSILLGMAVGSAAGFVNGLVITVGRVNAVIATLGTMLVFRSVASIVSDRRYISLKDTLSFNTMNFLNTPVVAISVVVIVAAAYFVLMRCTVTGRIISPSAAIQSQRASRVSTFALIGWQSTR